MIYCLLFYLLLSYYYYTYILVLVFSLIVLNFMEIKSCYYHNFYIFNFLMINEADIIFPYMPGQEQSAFVLFPFTDIPSTGIVEGLKGFFFFFV